MNVKLKIALATLVAASAILAGCSNGQTAASSQADEQNWKKTDTPATGTQPDNAKGPH